MRLDGTEGPERSVSPARIATREPETANSGSTAPRAAVAVAARVDAQREPQRGAAGGAPAAWEGRTHSPHRRQNDAPSATDSRHRGQGRISISRSPNAVPCGF